jgi:hypothetical protein
MLIEIINFYRKQFITDIFKKITKEYLKIVKMNNKMNFDQEKLKNIFNRFFQTAFFNT